jgi:Zn-dependent protease/predicted transcriptional regulator
MRESVRLGRVAGVAVGLNLSVFVILSILVVGLAAGRLPGAFPGRSPMAYVSAAAVVSVLFFASLLAHELAHAVVARRNGVEVEGITLWLFGGVAQLRSEPRTPGVDFRIAAVGPLTSLALAAGFGVVALALQSAGVAGLPYGVSAYLSGINLLLAVFNSVPAAPLDGGRVLRSALWRWRGDRMAAAIAAARVGQLFGYCLVALGVLQVAAGWGVDGLWLVLIGLFVVNAATAEVRHARLGARLHGVLVHEVMTPRPVTADPQETLDRFIAKTVLTHQFSSYPLTDPFGRLVGLTTLNRIRAVPPERRKTTRLIDIARRADEIPLAGPEEPLVDVLPRMAEYDDGRVVVVDGAVRVVGIVSPTDITRAILLRELTTTLGFDPYEGERGADVVIRRHDRAS